MNYQEINAKTIDRWIEEGWEWGTPVSHEVYMDALAGNWEVYLTPARAVPHECHNLPILLTKVLTAALRNDIILKYAA